MTAQLQKALQARLFRSTDSTDPDTVIDVDLDGDTLGVCLGATTGLGHHHPLHRTEIPTASRRALGLPADLEVSIDQVRDDFEDYSLSWWVSFPFSELSAGAPELAAWLRAAGFREKHVKAFEAKVKKRGAAFAIGWISQSVLDDYARFLLGEPTSFDWVAAGKRVATEDPRRFLAWLSSKGVETKDHERVLGRRGSAAMAKRASYFMKAFGRSTMESGSLNVTQARRARMRFTDAEARGQDPWQATSRRINATGNPAKVAGIRLFLSELLDERPERRDDTLELLAMVGDVPRASRGASRGKLDLGRVAAGISLDRVAAALDGPAPVSSPMAGVLLAKKWSGQDPSCYWMSEKLDGVRAIWDGRNFWSRTGKPFFAPAWFKAGMPSDVVLDGELFAGRGRFRETISAVRRKVPRDEQWRGIRYLAFDTPQVGGAFEQRMKKLRKVVDSMPGDSHLEMVAQRVCGGEAELAAFHRKIAAAGGEGVMLRLKGSPYESKRSSSLLKKKDFVDEEARVVGYKGGEGRHHGVLGAYKAELLSTGVGFFVGTGLTDAHRRQKLPVGTVITVRYQELTPGGVPRFPVFVGVRDYE